MVRFYVTFLSFQSSCTICTFWWGRKCFALASLSSPSLVSPVVCLNDRFVFPVQGRCEGDRIHLLPVLSLVLSFKVQDKKLDLCAGLSSKYVALSAVWGIEEKNLYRIKIGLIASFLLSPTMLSSMFFLKRLLS